MNPQLSSTIQELLARPACYHRATPLASLIQKGVSISATSSAAAAVSTAAASPSSQLPVISLVSFNILARPYCDGAARFQNHPTPEFLKWDYRRARIQEILAQSDADIICCQELTLAEFESAEVRDKKRAEREAVEKKEREEKEQKAKEKEMRKAKEDKRKKLAEARNAKKLGVEGDNASSSVPASESNAVEASNAADAVERPASANSDAEAPAASPPPAAASAALPSEPMAEEEKDHPPVDQVNATLEAEHVVPPEGDFASWLEQQGYGYALQQPAAREEKYPVGVGVFFKKSRFYTQPAIYDSRSRTLIVGLKLRPLVAPASASKSASSSSSSPAAAAEEVEPPASLSNVVFVCNLHLQGHYREVETRLNQVKSLMKQVEKHVSMLAPQAKPSQKKAKKEKKQKDAADAEVDAFAESVANVSLDSSASASAAAPEQPATATVPPNEEAMILICGDFNQNRRYSSVHRLLANGEVPANYFDEGVSSIVTPTKVTQPFPMQSSYENGTNGTNPHLKNSYPIFTFHNNHYKGHPFNDILDYCYFTTKSLQLLGNMQVVSEEEATFIENETSLPNPLIPSDHLPIGSTFLVPALVKQLEKSC